MMPASKRLGINCAWRNEATVLPASGVFNPIKKGFYFSRFVTYKAVNIFTSEPLSAILTGMKKKYENCSAIKYFSKEYQHKIYF